MDWWNDPLGWLEIFSGFVAVALAYSLGVLQERRRDQRQQRFQAQRSRELARRAYMKATQMVRQVKKDLKRLDRAASHYGEKVPGDIGLEVGQWNQLAVLLHEYDDDVGLQLRLGEFFGRIESLASLARRFDRVQIAEASLTQKTTVQSYAETIQEFLPGVQKMASGIAHEATNRTIELLKRSS